MIGTEDFNDKVRAVRSELCCGLKEAYDYVQQRSKMTREEIIIEIQTGRQDAREHNPTLLGPALINRIKEFKVRAETGLRFAMNFVQNRPEMSLEQLLAQYEIFKQDNPNHPM